MDLTSIQQCQRKTRLGMQRNWRNSAVLWMRMLGKMESPSRKYRSNYPIPLHCSRWIW